MTDHGGLADCCSQVVPQAAPTRLLCPTCADEQAAVWNPASFRRDRACSTSACQRSSRAHVGSSCHRCSRRPGAAAYSALPENPDGAAERSDVCHGEASVQPVPRRALLRPQRAQASKAPGSEEGEHGPRRLRSAYHPPPLRARGLRDQIGGGQFPHSVKVGGREGQDFGQENSAGRQTAQQVRCGSQTPSERPGDEPASCPEVSDASQHSR